MLSLFTALLLRLLSKRLIHSFLKHTLFVAEDDFRSLDFEQTLEAIVANEHAAIEVVQVGSGKTATIKGNEGGATREE